MDNATARLRFQGVANALRRSIRVVNPQKDLELEREEKQEKDLQLNLSEWANQPACEKFLEKLEIEIAQSEQLEEASVDVHAKMAIHKGETIGYKKVRAIFLKWRDKPLSP